ncbi:MAG: hypothetical protein K2N67_03465 [Mucispirillum sp.]|nr:hypothetical protein [Mucispirillum sp.]
MLELKLLLFAQGIRFLLFDYKLFRAVREAVSVNPIASWLLKCPFCQGFWCGFFSFLIPAGIWQAFLWGIGSAFISLTWFALVIPKLDEIEDGMAQAASQEK